MSRKTIVLHYKSYEYERDVKKNRVTLKKKVTKPHMKGVVKKIGVQLHLLRLRKPRMTKSSKIYVLHN